MPDVQTQTDPSPVGLESSDGFLRMNTFHPVQPPIPYYGSHWVDDGEPTFHPHPQSSYPASPPYQGQLAPSEPFSPSEHIFGGIEPHYFMDMPPPIPAGGPDAPQSNFPIVSPMHVTPDHQPGLNSEKIKELEHGEDNIREARDRVLGARFRLKDHRRELRDLRQKTSIEEGSIVSKLGKILRDTDVKLAEELDNAHARLLELRDQLGSLETEYEKAEERYEELEWKYTQKESNFVAKLIDDANYPQEENLTMTNVGSYVYVSGPTEASPQQLDYRDFQDGPVYDPSSGSIDLSGVLSLTTGLGSAITPTPDVEPLRLAAELAAPAVDTVASPITRSYSESAISEAHRMWANTRKRIEMWIFDSLICSTHQRLILKNMLARDDLDDNAWWQLVQETWSSDSPNTPPLGMQGACTASGASADAIITTVDERNVSDNADTERPEVETVRTLPTSGTLNEASTQAVSPLMADSRLDSIPGLPQQDCHTVTPVVDCSATILGPEKEPENEPEREPETEPEKEPGKEPEKKPKRVQHMGLRLSKASSLRRENSGRVPGDNTPPRYALSDSSLPRGFTKHSAGAVPPGNMDSGITPYDPWQRPYSTPRKQTVKNLNPIIAGIDNFTFDSDQLETDFI